MFFQMFGYLFGLFMAMHYYLFIIFLPALLNKLIDTLMKEDNN